MQSEMIGSVEYGQVFYFTVSNRAADGTALSFTPAYFDVYDAAVGERILANQELIPYDTDLQLWRGSIDTGVVDTDQTEDWASGRTYSIVVKETVDLEPAVFLHYQLTVTGAFTAKLKRCLGLNGENMLLDSFSYDSAGNCTGCRIRIFETKADAEAATAGTTELEPGEIYQYTVATSYSTGRALRASELISSSEEYGDE